MQIYKKTFFQRVDFRENFNNCGNVALNLSTGSKYCIGDNQMRVAKTGKFSRRDKLSHHKMFWFACSVVCKMPLTVAARTITNLLRTNFHLCDGCFSCCRITVLRRAHSLCSAVLSAKSDLSIRRSQVLSFCRHLVNSLPLN